MRRMTTIPVWTVAVWLLVHPSLAAQRGPVEPQRQGRRPWMSQAERAERHAFQQDVVEALRRAAGGGRRRREMRRFAAISRQVARRLPLAELRELAGKPKAERIRLVIEVWRRQRDAADERFLRNVEPAVADELRRLGAEERHARIMEMRVDRGLERAIRNALRCGLLDEAAARKLRSGDLRTKTLVTRKLDKKTFLHVYADELGEREHDRLKALDVRLFFSDPVVRRYRLILSIPRAEIRRLRGLGARDRGDLLRRLRTGGDLEPLVRKGILGARLARRLSKLDRGARRRLARDLRRIHLRDRWRPAIPERYLRELTALERRRFFRLGDRGRLRFLEQRFPGVDWKSEALKKLGVPAPEGWGKMSGAEKLRFLRRNGL